MSSIACTRVVVGVPVAMSGKKRNYLSLEKKRELIKTSQSHPSASVRSLGERFNCSKTQVAYILKNKASILSMYETNQSGSRVHAKDTARVRTSEYAEVNDKLYEWYLLACSKNIFPGGPQLIEKAKQIAERLGKSDFKGSNGWLEKWKKGSMLKWSKYVENQGMFLVIPLNHG